MRGQHIAVEIEDVPGWLQQPHYVGVQGQAVGARVVPHTASAQISKVRSIARVELMLGVTLVQSKTG